MKTLSTGRPSNIETWINLCIQNFGVDSAATKYMEACAEDVPNGLKEEVVAEEGKLMLALASISQN